MTLDEIKAALCKGEFSSMSITWNDGNGPNYQTVKQWLEDDATLEPNRQSFADEDFVAPGERDRCIATNSMWTAHWYPNTPVGFNSLHAATFEALKAGLEKLALEDAT